VTQVIKKSGEEIMARGAQAQMRDFCFTLQTYPPPLTEVKPKLMQMKTEVKLLT